MIRVTTVSSGPRATTWTRSISPQPVTQGAVPSSRQPPPAGSALSCGGPGMSPLSAWAARVGPGDRLADGNDAAGAALAGGRETPVAQRGRRIAPGQRLDQPEVLDQ